MPPEHEWHDQRAESGQLRMSSSGGQMRRAEGSRQGLELGGTGWKVGVARCRLEHGQVLQSLAYF